MPKCRSIVCELRPDTAIYSLSTNLAFNGTAISFIVPCPEGFVCDSTWPRTVTYPPNTFVFPLPDPQGCSPLAPLRFQGCSSEIIVAIPLCSTAAQIAVLGQQVIQLAGAQQALCDSLDPDGPFPPPQPETFTNVQTSIGCENANLQLTVTGGTLPPGITFAGGLLTAAAGIFGGSTQAIANFNATEFLESLRDDLIDNGDAECFCVGGFTATPDADSIDLSWAAHPLADSYIVERATISGGPYTQLINTSGTSYDDETAVEGTTHYYIITPRSLGSNLCESEEVSAVIGNNIFEDLIWVEQFVVQDGGAASGTFLAENFTASAESTGSWFQAGGDIQYIGTLLYTGDAINCEINITAFSFSSSGVPQPQFSVIITSDADGTLISQVVTATGVFAFTIPASVGATISVTIEALATNGSEFDTANQTISATGSINGPV